MIWLLAAIGVILIVFAVVAAHVAESDNSGYEDL